MQKKKTTKYLITLVMSFIMIFTTLVGYPVMSFAAESTEMDGVVDYDNEDMNEAQSGDTINVNDLIQDNSDLEDTSNETDISIIMDVSDAEEEFDLEPFAIGDEEDVAYAFTFDVENVPNSYTIYKIDGTTEEPLENAHYQVYREGADDTDRIAENIDGQPIMNNDVLVTNHDGKITLYNLQDGTYHYKEVQPPPNYILQIDENGDPIVYTFTVEDCTVTDAYTSNYEITSFPLYNMTGYTMEIYIKKLASDNSQEIKDAVFEVYQWDTTMLDEETGEYGKYDTDTPIGLIIYSDTTKTAKANDRAYHYYNQYPYEYTETNLGKFKIMEIATDTGYFADWEREIQIDTRSRVIAQEVVFDDDDVVINTNNEVRIYKVDNETGNYLVGATFKIEPYIDPLDAISYDGTDYAQEKTVEEIGVPVIFTKLPEGNYKITETAAPENYTISDEVIYLIVDSEGKITQAQLPTDENTTTVLEPKPGMNADGTFTYTYRDDYSQFSIHKIGRLDASEDDDIDVETSSAVLEGAKFEFKVGRWLSNGTFQEYQSGNEHLGENDFIGYLVKGTKDGAYDENTDVDEYGIKVYQGDTLVTDENGDIAIRMMIDGAWQYTETESVAPYKVPKQNGELIPSYFTVQDRWISDDSHENDFHLDMEILNTPNERPTFGYVNLKVEKIDGDTKEHINNVRFDVYEFNVRTQEYDTYVTTLIPDEDAGDGFYKNEDKSLPITTLNGNGKFKVIEVANQDGYISNWEAEFNAQELDKDETESNTVMIQYIGEEAVENFHNKLTIWKYDAMSQTGLKDAVIEVWTSDESDTVIGYLDDGTEVMNHAQFHTDAKGEISISQLINDRTYYAQEKQAPMGFTPDYTPRSVIVTKDGYMYNEADLPEAERFIPGIDGTYTIRKLNEETGDPMSGVMMEIWQEDIEDDVIIGQAIIQKYVDDDEDGNPIYEEETVDIHNHSTFATDENGEIKLSGLDVTYFRYLDTNEVERSGSYRLGIPNTMLLATGGAGRTMIYIIGCTLLVAIMIGFITLERKKKTNE